MPGRGSSMCCDNVCFAGGRAQYPGSQHVRRAGGADALQGRNAAEQESSRDVTRPRRANHGLQAAPAAVAARVTARVTARAALCDHVAKHGVGTHSCSGAHLLSCAGHRSGRSSTWAQDLPPSVRGLGQQVLVITTQESRRRQAPEGPGRAMAHRCRTARQHADMAVSAAHKSDGITPLLKTDQRCKEARRARTSWLPHGISCWSSRTGNNWPRSRSTAVLAITGSIRMHTTRAWGLLPLTVMSSPCRQGALLAASRTGGLQFTIHVDFGWTARLPSSLP